MTSMLATASSLTLALALMTSTAMAQDDKTVTRGLKVNEPEAFQGYTMFVPLNGSTTYLIDMEGEIAHTWKSDVVGGSPYLLDDGHILRDVGIKDPPRFRGGGMRGRFQKLDWEGNVVWDYTFSSDDYLSHHDIAPTPDGTILFISWEYKDGLQCLEAGRHPKHMQQQREMWPDFVMEIDPIEPNDAEIIWEWHAWDHLIQDYDPDQSNYGVVKDHPELIDINADRDHEADMSDEDLEKLKEIGYLAQGTTQKNWNADWLHINAIDYNPDLDQIALSVPKLNEIWIIDHSTTIEEAAGHEGGRYGKGGDLLYRWGNPVNYGAGTPADQRLYFQHDVRWIPPGFPGEGNLTIFNNGRGRKFAVDGISDYSSIIELVTPIDDEGHYRLTAGEAFGPPDPVWIYTAEPKDGFYSHFISGAARLPNGNTLICEGSKGRLFEVTASGKIVWEYWNPFDDVAGQGFGEDPHAVFRATRIPLDHPGLEGTGLGT